MKIAVRAPNWIGDSVLALPAVAALHENFPEAEIWICGQEWIKDLFLPLDYIKGVISLKNSSTLKGLLQEAKILKKHKFDLGLLLTNSFSSALLFYMAKIKKRWGYNRDFRRFLLTKKVGCAGIYPLANLSGYQFFEEYVRTVRFRFFGSTNIKSP
jgi:heptosyltransferase-2